MALDLDLIRQDIDKIDRELLALMEKRMDLVSQVAAYKKETGKPILDTGREEAVLAKVASLVENKDYEETLVASFADIMKQSRAYQAKTLAD